MRERLALKERGDRKTLTALSDPRFESWLAGLSLPLDQINDLRRFYKKLVADRNAFDINRRRGGLFVPEGHRVDRARAERLLANAISELSGALHV
ncbi:hypothetical protein [Novosphingobium olei]|uniref:Uncharacterized protein n=1 Tax=Novosphingobium olei TaxID=2728851 RepID=A0A7Y0GAJ9_9SPHN|nr:hypothetical protein [Novosphingobium olei]NML95150.1 hypothetical protein [Novosphingobium olei]